MRPETDAWVAIAEGDCRLAHRALRPPHPIYDGAGFHAQQGIEKYLKAVLEEAERPIPRTHDLGQLLVLTADLLPGLAPHHATVEAIAPYAVALCLPHDAHDLADQAEEATSAVRTMDTVRSLVRAALGLPESAPREATQEQTGP